MNRYLLFIQCCLRRSLKWGVLLGAISTVADAQTITGATDVPVVFSPATTTETLLAKYAQLHAKPNQYWQLTDEEWIRYEHIKKNSPWSAWENNASPLAILAHYSQSPEEKRKYARIDAELDTWRQHAVVEFQTLYDKERAIVYEKYAEWFNQRKPTIATLRPGDRLRLFISAETCNVHCRTLIGKVLQSQAKLDIYVVGAKTDLAIFQWAESAGIPVDRVKTKEITLNHDNGLLKRRLSMQWVFR